MEVHIGREIEKKYNESGLKLSEFAKKINTGTRNVYSIFKRRDISSALLKKIGEALNFDFFQLYQRGYKKDFLRPAQAEEAWQSLSTPSKVRPITISIELDGTEGTMDYWLTTIRKVNSAMQWSGSNPLSDSK